MVRLILLILGLSFPLSLVAQAGRGEVPSGMARIESGRFRPLYAQPGEDTVHVKAFALDMRPVSRGEFSRFVRAHERWQRDRIAALFADRGYLQDWTSATEPGGNPSAPVTNVSWFAARAYCAAAGKRLPITNEWEYVARADEKDVNAARATAFRQRALDLLLRPGDTFTNMWGVFAMHGSTHEWVSDFQAIFAGSDSRVSSRREPALTCAASATASGEASDYAAFLRYSMRGSVEGRSTLSNLGFRCAQSI